MQLKELLESQSTEILQNALKSLNHSNPKSYYNSSECNE